MVFRWRTYKLPFVCDIYRSFKKIANGFVLEFVDSNKTDETIPDFMYANHNIKRQSHIYGEQEHFASNRQIILLVCVMYYSYCYLNTLKNISFMIKGHFDDF